MSPSPTKLDRKDLPEIAQLCTAASPLDPWSEQLIEKRIFADPRHDPELTVGLKDQGRLLGMITGVLRQHSDRTLSGWIKLLAVDPRYQRRGLGRELLNLLEARFRQHRVTRIDTVGHPNYFWPGINVRNAPACRLLEKLGYTEHRELVNMAVDLSDRHFGVTEARQRLESQGYELTRADRTLAPGLHEWIARHWPVWSHEVDTALANDPVSMFCAHRDQQPVAYAAYDIEMFPGTFGSMATDPQHRGRGLGAALLHACLYDMKQKGYARCEIAWVGPAAFYAQNANASICRVFRDYRKPLNRAQ
jgi:ribosomal protein S18 acetylase RimI-like enzyme